MPGDRHRMSRAGDYVLGLMEEAERKRAERDLEIDPAFREAVLTLAARLYAFRSSEPRVDDEQWRQVARHIAGLPQMRDPPQSVPRAKPVLGGAPRPVGRALHAIGGGRGLIVALGLMAAFALGYLSARY